MTERRVGDQRDVVLSASSRHAVGEHVGSPQAKLHLDGYNLGVLDSFMDGGRSYLAERNAAKKALVDELLHRCKRVLHRDVGVTSGTLKNVNLLAALQLLDAVAEGPADFLRGAIRGAALGTTSTLDTKDDLIGILGVLLKVLLEDHKGIVLGRPIEFAAVPEGVVVLDGSLHGFDGLLQGRWGWAPCHA